MKHNTIEFIYFDGMHVLFEKTRTDASMYTHELGIEEDFYEEILQEVIQTQPQEIRDQFWSLATIQEEEIYFNRFHKDFCDYLGIKPTAERIRRLTYLRMHGEYILKDGVKETLAALYPHYGLGVLTNAMPSRRVHELTLNGIDQYFTSIVISREIGSFKPDKKIYEYAIKQSHTNPENILFVDDIVEYLDAAKNADIGQCILFSIYESSDTYPMISSFEQILLLIKNFE